MNLSTETVKDYLIDLQARLCQQFASEDGQADFIIDPWQRAEGGGGCSRVICNGAVFEKGGVNFSHVMGECLPAAATQQRPELAGCPFEAMGVSVVMHPLNPYVPTSHMNVRLFCAKKSTTEQVWWFGGGYDLTPYYGFDEDCQHWHKTAKKACGPFGKNLYEQYKQQCDDYFYLKHRQEPRGIGGLFFDDVNDGGFDRCFQLLCSIGDSYSEAYLPLVQRRKQLAYTDQQRQFQLFRRGRYVEFNLLYDRGTLFGLQSGGRTESILMSLPPLVRWDYDYTPPAGSEEAKLYQHYLKPQTWLST